MNHPVYNPVYISVYTQRKCFLCRNLFLVSMEELEGMKGKIDGAEDLWQERCTHRRIQGTCNKFTMRSLFSRRRVSRDHADEQSSDKCLSCIF